MSPSRIDQAFAAAKREGRAALIVYVCAGDPSLAATARLVPELARAGADVIEIGVPFSDPIADGPVIQAASERALAGGASLRAILGLVETLRAEGCEAALCLMSYLNPIHALAGGVLSIARAGIDGLILPDLPFDEGEPWSSMHAAVRESGMDMIPLAAPTTHESRLSMLGEAASGFLYFVSVTGVTGARSELPIDLGAQLEAARSVSRVPVAVGFGVDSPAQARSLAAHADGVIVGSALIQRLRSDGEGAAVAFVRDLAQALREPPRRTTQPKER